ncbi:MAG: CusA/CzcA family heavy metal efflux RND transporter [Sandaracinus sp.]
MEALLRFCLSWRVAVLALVATIVSYGVHSALTLPIDAVPDVTSVQVQVLTSAPALPPLDVERTITTPVERAMSGLPGLEEVRSVSRFGVSAVTLVFGDGTDLVRARQLVGERLVGVRSEIPSSLGSPELGPMSSGLGEVLQFEVRGEGRSLMELREILDWFVAYELRTVPGVVEVNPFGGERRTYEVEVDPQRLAAHGLALADLYGALDDNNTAEGGGALVHSGESLLVRADARFTSLADVEETIVTANGEGIPVRVRDLGQVHFAPMVRQGAVTRDGHGEVVIGTVMMLVGENGRDVVTRARERIDEIAPSLPDGVTIDVYYDRAEIVNRTIETVGENLAVGALIVLGVLFVLLGSVRGGLIVAAAIPFAMLVAFIGMNAMGLSGNLMSLGAIDFGIVVDGSIIVVENAVVHLAAALHDRGKPMTYTEAAQVVLRSTLEVRRAATFGEAIIVLVYVPILTLAGIEGRMFRPMAIAVLFALLGAFIASLTFVPVMVATLLRNHASHEDPWVVRKLSAVYPRLLQATMRAPVRVLGVAVVALGVTGWIATGLGADFVPRLDEGSLIIEVSRLPSVSLDQAITDSTRLENAIGELSEIDTVVCKTGRPEIANDPMGIWQSDCHVELTPQSEWTDVHDRDSLIALLTDRIEERVPGVGFGFSQPIEMRFAELNGGTRSDLAVTIYGDDLDELARLSVEVQRALRGVPGAVDVRGEQVSGLPTLDVVVDRAVAARYGVTARSALDAVAAVGGRPSGEAMEGQRRIPIQVRLPPDVRQDIGALGRIPVRGTGQLLVPLAEVARLDIVDAPASISHEAIRRRTTVECNVRGRDLASFVAEAQRVVPATVRRPPGYTFGWAGQYRNLAEASARLALAVPAALALIFILLYAAFGAFRPALVIFLNVPFAAVGGVLLLWARGMPFSISAGIGFIALFGIAVLNGVVLLTTIERNLADGQAVDDAVTSAAKARLRAVVMTASVAALGFLPMAVATSSGAEVQRPLATVVVGGLITATLLTLLVLPTLYAWISRRWPTEHRPPPTDAATPAEHAA